MLCVRLVRMIEDHAEQLTRGVLEDLKGNPRTPAYHRLSREQLDRRVYEVLRNFAQWLSYQTDQAIEAWYGELGRQRFAENTPLAEVVYALILTKQHLQDYVRSAGLADSALELYQELELYRLAGRFFDKAIYYAVRGYELAAAPRGESNVAGQAR